ncbi:hypothetical protein T439DRAFT_381350 [Meredithblackwellia eburnea MCA 4105]
MTDEPIVNPTPIQASTVRIPTYPGEVDAEARWAKTRAAWLSPNPSQSDTQKRTRDPVFAARLKLLDTLLTPAPTTLSSAEPTAAATKVSGVLPSGSSSGLLLNSDAPKGTATPQSDVGNIPSKSSKTEELDLMALEPDGGDVIAPQRAKHAAALASVAPLDSEKAIEGILTAFRLGRRLKEPLPLTLVTKLLYRQWHIDGTIPPGYESTTAQSVSPALEPIKPEDDYPRPKPHWMSGANEATSSVKSTTNSTAAFWLPPPSAPTTAVEVESGGLTVSAPIPVPQAKYKVGELLNSGSSWREEADVASGDDVM